MKESIIQIRLPEQLKDQLKEYADKRGMSMSEAVRYVIRKEIEEDADG